LEVPKLSHRGDAATTSSTLVGNTDGDDDDDEVKQPSSRAGVFPRGPLASSVDITYYCARRALCCV